MKFIFESVKLLNNLQSVSIDVIQLPGNCENEISQALMNKHLLKELSIYAYENYKYGTAIVNVMVSHKNLEKVVFHSCIAHESELVIAKIISNNANLQKLDISGSKISYYAFKGITSALKKHTSLAEFIVNKSDIVLNSYKDLSNALCVNNSIKHLDMSYNKRFIGDSGGQAIKKMLSYNRSITNINVDGNWISDRCLNVISQKTMKNDRVALLNVVHVLLYLFSSLNDNRYKLPPEIGFMVIHEFLKISIGERYGLSPSIFFSHLNDNKNIANNGSNNNLEKKGCLVM